MGPSSSKKGAQESLRVQSGTQSDIHPGEPPADPLRGRPPNQQMQLTGALRFAPGSAADLQGVRHRPRGTPVPAVSHD